MIPILDTTAAAETSYQKGKKYFSDALSRGKVFNCSPGYVSGHCAGGHKFAAVQYCGREYCPDCSRDGSPIHQRRVKNGWSVCKEWDGMGYYVITIPENLRYLFFDTEILRDFRFKILRKIKETYKYKQGLARWHWFGDCLVCGGSGCLGCNDTGAGQYWHPHLNILVPDGGYIKDLDDHLLPLRRFMSMYFRKLIDREISIYKAILKIKDSDELMILLDDLYQRRDSINAAGLVVNYSYATDEKQMMNRVKYVTRATFKIYDDKVKTLLYNFRNSIVWGWKKNQEINEAAEDMPVLCPECEKAGVRHVIKWGTISKFKEKDTIKKHITDGQNNQPGRGGGLYSLSNGNITRDGGNIGFMAVQFKRINEPIRGGFGAIAQPV